MIASLLGVSTEDLLALAKVLGALVVIGTAILGLFRLRGIRWIWARLVTDPLGSFFRAQVVSVTEPQFSAAARALEAHTAYEHSASEDLHRALLGAVVRIENLDERIDELADRVDRLSKK